MRAAHRRPEWQHEVLNRARITTVITDAYNDPLLDPRPALGANYRSVMRTNSLALGWHPDSRDHNGNSAHELLQRVGLSAGSFDEYLVALEKLVAGMAARGQVALKNALAYDRDVNFDEPDEPTGPRRVGQELRRRRRSGRRLAISSWIICAGSPPRATCRCRCISARGSFAVRTRSASPD